MFSKYRFMIKEILLLTEINMNIFILKKLKMRETYFLYPCANSFRIQSSTYP